MSSRNLSKYALIIPIVLVVVAGAIYGGFNWAHLVAHKTQPLATSSSQVQKVSPPPVLAIPSTPPGPSVVVSFDQYGFEPNEFVVPVGTTIFVSNATTRPLLFMPLPIQIGNLPGLDLGTIAPGNTKSFVVSSAGSWQFEANNSPALRGNVSGVNESLASWQGLSDHEMPKYDPATKSLLINYTNFGFVPNIARVPVGTKVSVLNSTTDGGIHFMALNNDPNLDLGILDIHQSASFILKHSGTWLYENSWETTDIGQITAQ